MLSVSAYSSIFRSRVRRAIPRMPAVLYSAASLVGWYTAGGHGSPWWSYALLLASAVVAGVVMGLVLEKGLLQRLYHHVEILMVIITYALMLVLEDLAKLVWGVSPYMTPEPYSMLGRSQLGRIAFSNYDLALILVSAFVGLVCWAILQKTHTGRLLRAVIHDREICVAMGVNVKRMFTLTFVAGATLGALAGALTAPAISVTPGIGVEVIVLAFAVVVVGGLGSIEGAAVGALLVGMTRAVAVHKAPEVELFVIYAVMALVLAVRPQGLFGRVLARKI